MAIRGLHISSTGGQRPDSKPVTALREERRSLNGRHLALGTLACARCDAPVDPGSRPLRPGQQLNCPFCAHRAPVREFLSLAEPSRPARVVVRLTLAGPVISTQTPEQSEPHP